MTKLWLDLGNTRLKYWLIDEQDSVLEHDARLHLQAPAELLMGLSDKFKRLSPTFIGISSVLGDTINHSVRETLDNLGVDYQFAKVQSTHPQLTTDYDPNQLGVDRWLQMLGAVDGGHQCIIGCGTAITIDIIENSHHLGGYIFPNARLQREALDTGTRQIDVQSGSFEQTCLATNTSDAVNHGILLNIVGAIHQIMKTHPQHTLIMTGGDAKLIARHLDYDAIIRQDLLLKGLKRFFAHR